jgi:hypothetical protein
MRTSTAFFAGVGTVFVAIAAGLGGGLTIANVMTSQTSQHSKLDRRASIDAPSTKDPMVPVPYLAATKDSTNAAVVVSPAAKPAQPQRSEAVGSPPATQPATAQANMTASNEQPAKLSEAVQADASKSAQTAAATPSVAAAQPVAAHEQASAPEDANAKAREVDLKRNGDQKRAERRKVERRAQQQWADRRRSQQNRDQDELRGVEEAVREDSEARAYPAYREQPARAEFPQIRLFGDD